MTLREVVEGALRALPTNCAPATARTYSALLRRFLHDYPELDQPAGKLQPRTLAHWIAQRTHWRPMTRLTFISALRWAHKRAGVRDPALATDGPASDIAFATIPPHRAHRFFLPAHALAEIRTLSPEHFGQMRYIGLRNRAITLFVLDTLASVTEILHARRNDLHADGKHITLHMRPLPHNVVQVQEDTMQAIQDMLAVAPHSPWLFASRKRGGRLRQSGAWKGISKALAPFVPERAYIQSGRAIELLRASAARALVLELGKDEETVMRMLGVRHRDAFRVLIGLAPPPGCRIAA